MKRPRIVKDSGPYQVRYQDEYHCCIEVYLPVGKYGKTKTDLPELIANVYRAF